MTRGRRSTQARALLVAAAVLGLACIAGVFLWLRASPQSSVPDARSARPVILSYLTALETRDRSAVRGFAPPDYDADAEVADRIAKYGGARAVAASITFDTELSKAAPSVLIETTSAAGRPLAWRETVFWREGQWWIVLGSLKGVTHTMPTAGTERRAP